MTAGPQGPRAVRSGSRPADGARLRSIAVQLEQLASSVHDELANPLYQVVGTYERHYADLTIQLREMLPDVTVPPARELSSFVSSTNSLQEAAACALRTIEHAARALAVQVRALIPVRPGPPEALAIVERICTRFHLVARQLRERQGNRPPFQVDNEYDVQDLLHSLLRLDFDDIRPEEWTPSYAGSSARMDFLLKDEKVVVEVKMTRPGLRGKEVGEQLLLDIEHYKVHPDCETLVCFVYDPDHRIANPRGLVSDLEKGRTRPVVKVYVCPPGS